MQDDNKKTPEPSLLFDFSIKLSNHSIKKNGKTIRWRGFGKAARPYICSTTEQINAERTLMLALRLQANNIGFDIIKTPVRAMFLFYFPRDRFFTQKGEISRNLPDLSNLVQGPEDALEGSGIIENDTLIHSLDGSRRLPGDCYELRIQLYNFEAPIG